MRSTTSQRSSAATSRSRKPVVCVVDPQSDDYQSWQSLAEAAGVELEFCASAAEALRRQLAGRVDLWVVNADLPHVSGTELCAMLKSGTNSGAICLVANEHSAAIERQALVARATVFVCKPLHTSQFRAWLGHVRMQQVAATTTPRAHSAAHSNH